MAIVSYRDERLARILERDSPGKGFPADLVKAVRRKLVMLDGAASVEDLRVLPGNRLERLTADRQGQYSIRVNDQFRICFVWTDGGPANVEFVDYH